MSLQKKDPSLRVAANDPHLVSLGGGRLSTAVTIHNIPVGDCTIGSSSQCAISLGGAGVKPIHCTIYRSEENEVTLVPEHNARILIDNQVIDSEIDLRQGAMITIGDSYYLRYNNPAEALQMRSAIEQIEEKFSSDLNFIRESNISPALSSYCFDREACGYYNSLRKTDTAVVLADLQCPKVFSANLVTVNMPAKDVLGQKYVNFAKNLTKHHGNDINIAFFDNILEKTQSKINDKKENGILPSSQLKLAEAMSILPDAKESAVNRLEDLQKKNFEYTAAQDRSLCCNGSTTSSPIVQNRIITNGSLPRDKKSQRFQELQSGTHMDQLPKSSDCEAVYVKETTVDSVPGNLNYVRQIPQTKILTNYAQDSKIPESLPPNLEKPVRSFEEKEVKNPLYNYISKTTSSVNNFSIDIKSFVSPYSSPTFKKFSQCGNELINSKSLTNLLSNPCCYDKWHRERDDLLKRIRSLKKELDLLKNEENETLMAMDIEQAFVAAEMQTFSSSKENLQKELESLQRMIYRLEAQRNATRVMEENQQSKLQNSIELKQDQVKKLKEFLKQNPDNNHLKDELSNARETLENDKKSFEDLEFQYLEGESEWQAYRDDLNLEEQRIKKQIEEYQSSLKLSEMQMMKSSFTINTRQSNLSNHLISLIKELNVCELQFNNLERYFSLNVNPNSPFLKQQLDKSNKLQRSQISQSSELLRSKTNNENIMSKSLNDDIYLNNQIDFLKNELITNNSINKINDVNAKSNIYETKNRIKKTKNPNNCRINYNELRDLNYQRRKIEEILRNLTSNDKAVSVDAIVNNDFQKKDNARIITSPHSLTKKLELNNTFSLNVVNKYNDPKMNCQGEYSCSSTISNEISSQCGQTSATSGDSKMTHQQKQRPLTRYLPNFSENFDLKQHIESAGHPISLCNHIILDAHSCRGYLNKLGATFHAWSKRWFVLDRRRSALVYYADKSERKLRGVSNFSSIHEVYLDHLNISKSGRTHSTFIVKTKNKTYFLQASSDTVARIWIDVIITGAQGNIDY